MAFKGCWRARKISQYWPIVCYNKKKSKEEGSLAGRVVKKVNKNSGKREVQSTYPSLGPIKITFLNYLQDSTPLVVPAIVFGATSFSAGIVAMLLPETRGKPLPDFVGKETAEKENKIPMEESQEVTGYTSAV